MARARRRVAITGAGVLCGLGGDLATFWQACLEGRSVVAPVPDAWRRYSTLRSDFWAPLGGWARPSPLLSRLEAKHLDPVSRLAILAAEEALAGAALEVELADRKRNRYRLSACPGERAAVFMGTGIGGISSALRSHRFVLLDRARRRLVDAVDALRGSVAETALRELASIVEDLAAPPAFDPYSVPMAMPSAISANLSIKLGLRGPSRTFSSACSSGTVAIGRALEALRQGECDLALAGGVEYLGDEEGGCFRSFDALGALARGPLPAEQLNRPFDEERSGFLFGEGGAAVLVLEPLELAAARGAPALAELRGFGETCDAHHILAMDPEATQIRRAIELCLEDAGLEPRAIDYVNAHGTGTPQNDPIECRVLEALFGDRPAINSSKSLLGHTLGASGALEAVVTVLSLRDGTTHPTRNLSRPISDLNFVRHAGPQTLRHAISQSFAFGGQNAVLAFSRVED